MRSIQSVGLLKALYTFCLPGRPVHSDTNSASPGSILARQQLRAKAKSLTFLPLSIARYSFIQLSEQGRQWRERKCPIFETVTKRDSNLGSQSGVDCESGILPLSYRAPHPPNRYICISKTKCMVTNLKKRPPSWIFNWPIGPIWLDAPKEYSCQIWCLYHNLHDWYHYLPQYMARMLPGEVELLSEIAGLSGGGAKCTAFWAVQQTGYHYLIHSSNHHNDSKDCAIMARRSMFEILHSFRKFRSTISLIFTNCNV